MTSGAARCSRGLSRGSVHTRCKACFEVLPRARVGWHTSRTSLPDCRGLRHTLERSASTVAHGIRGQRVSGVAAAPRSRAVGGARATACHTTVCGRAIQMAGDGRKPCAVVVVVGVAVVRANDLRLVFPDV